MHVTAAISQCLSSISDNQSIRSAGAYFAARIILNSFGGLGVGQGGGAGDRFPED